MSKTKPPLIIPYHGIANQSHLFLKGRVLSHQHHFRAKNSLWSNLLDTFYRIHTDELCGIRVQLQVDGQKFSEETDREGYFTFEKAWNGGKTDGNIVSVDLYVADNTEVSTKAELQLCPPQAKFGVLSDVDDTVLQSAVTSPLRALYLMFFKNAKQRKPMEGMVDYFHQLAQVKDEKPSNPFFYVSNSPWNLFDMISDFLYINAFPKGSLFLRDFGLRPTADFSQHKMETITRILEFYPDLPFLFFGDTASNDADFYLDLAKKFPERVKAIYIRKTKDTRNARRVAELIAHHDKIPILLVESAREMAEDAQHHGFF